MTSSDQRASIRAVIAAEQRTIAHYTARPEGVPPAQGKGVEEGVEGQVSMTTLQGDCRQLLPTLSAESVQCIVTSPPYWRMRKYTDDPREIGQEQNPAEYVTALAGVFAQCWRVLRNDGVLWLNLGDGYARGFGGGTPGAKSATNTGSYKDRSIGKVPTGLPPKSLIGMPWRVAFALQDAGWILRTEIIWEKPNAMPESVTDRPTRSHEYVFLFVKSARYYFDSAAIAERASQPAGTPKLTGQIKAGALQSLASSKLGSNQGSETRNARTVWNIPTTGLADEHYAPMPQALAERCIRAGSAAGDTVLDPFAGSGTTLRAAMALQRSAIGIELGGKYLEIQDRRTNGVQVEMVDLI